MMSWKRIKSLEKFGQLIKSFSKMIKNEAKKQKGGSLDMLLGKLGARLLGNLLTDKGVIRAGEGTNKSRPGFLKPFHPLTNFEQQNYYQNEFEFNAVYSRSDLCIIHE